MESPVKISSPLTIDMSSDLDKQKSDNHFLTQQIQEIKWESEHKDKIINDLQTVIYNLKCRLRANNLADDVRSFEEDESKQNQTCLNIKALLEKARLADTIQASKDGEYLVKLVKENEFYKNTIRDLHIRLHSKVPTASFHNLQHDLQQFSEQCQQMSQKLMAYDSHDFPMVNLMEENKQLRNKIIEIQNANKKWKGYCSKRESILQMAVAKLTAANKESSTGSPHHIPLQSYKDSKTNEEELLALKTQVKIYAEDFESERKDREKAQSRISDLESEILKLKQQRDMPHKQQLLRSYSGKGSRYHEPKESVPRGLSEGPYINAGYQKDTLDGSYKKRADKYEVDGVPNTKQNFICPSCNMVFGSDKQAELLAHVDLCF